MRLAYILFRTFIPLGFAMSSCSPPPKQYNTVKIIPLKYHGIWMPDYKKCSNKYDINYMHISGSSIDFHEYSGTVSGLISILSDHKILIRISFEGARGEGDPVYEDISIVDLEIEDKGRTISLSIDNSPSEIWFKCRPT